MNQYSKSTCVTKMIFWILKEILEDYSPGNLSPRASVDHERRQPRFLHFLNDPKKYFEKFFFLRIVQFAKITCFERFLRGRLDSFPCYFRESRMLNPECRRLGHKHPSLCSLLTFFCLQLFH